MTKNSPQGPIPREALQRWLNTGSAPLTAEDRSGSLVTLLKLPKTPEIDYLYGTSARRTIYEAPPVQTEEQDVSLKIGGI